MAMLAVRAYRVLTLAQLIEGVWGGSPRPAPRRASTPTSPGYAGPSSRGAGGASPRGAGPHRRMGYRLNLDPGRIDTHVFAGRVDAAARAAKGGDLDEAVRELDEALPSGAAGR